MNQLIKYFARFVSVSWDFGGLPAWWEKHQLLIAAERDPLLPPGRTEPTLKTTLLTKKRSRISLKKIPVSQGPRRSSPVASRPKPSTPQDRSSCEFPMLSFDDLYPPQEWVHVEGIHGRRYRNYAHFALPPSELKEEIATCKARGNTYETINGLFDDFKHQGEHGAWIYRFNRTSCGCCLSVGLNCPNLTYRPPAGANPKTLFIPPWWDSSDKIPLRNDKFFQHRSSSKRAPPDSEAEAVPHSSIIEAVVVEFGPSSRRRSC
ncbi:hypothetical protein EDD85DRAFT_962745 [Armillaria nabsnona]|nr:hypothetical protein EDD85DRAFT_962745 [Armillaria nabsnona]